MSGLESDVCKIQHLHVTLEGAIREFRNYKATLFVYSFVPFTPYSKWTNWRQMSKLLSSFGCLLLFATYSVWAN